MPRKPDCTQAEEGTRHEGLIGQMRLLTPTQRQWTRNKLEEELLIQIAFSRRVSDAVTQPILDVGGRRVAPSMVFTLYTDLEKRPLIHLVEVDAGDGRLDAATLAADRTWCSENGAGFHVLDEAAIRTDRLATAILMTPYVGHWPLDEDVDAISKAINAGGGTCTAAQAAAAIVAEGVEPGAAEAPVVQAVANWFFDCDLSGKYGPNSRLQRLDPGGYLDSAQDPFLAFLHPAEGRAGERIKAPPR